MTYTASCSIAATATGTLSNTATVSSSITDPTPGNNSATDSDTLSPSTDLALTKTDSPDPVIVGNNLTYTITATNNGSSAATGVVITDTLPANVTLVSATSSQGSCSGIATVSCTIGSLNNGANATATIVVTPTVAGPLSNTASVSGTESDPRPGNNSSTATTTVNANAPTAAPAWGSRSGLNQDRLIGSGYRRRRVRLHDERNQQRAGYSQRGCRQRHLAGGRHLHSGRA